MCKQVQEVNFRWLNKFGEFCMLYIPFLPIYTEGLQSPAKRNLFNLPHPTFPKLWSQSFVAETSINIQQFEKYSYHLF